MDLTNPLRSLSPGLDSEVLAVLAGAPGPYSASQIARLADRGTRQGLTVALQRLAAHGVVRTEPGNNGPMYRLNRDHLLYRAVMEAAGVRELLFDRLRTWVKDLHPRPAHASIFGSFARGEAGPQSDIDLLLILPDGASETDWENDLNGLRTDVEEWTGNGVDTLVFTIDRLQEIVTGGEPITEAWRHESLHLVGRRLNTLLRGMGVT